MYDCIYLDAVCTCTIFLDSACTIYRNTVWDSVSGSCMTIYFGSVLHQLHLMLHSNIYLATVLNHTAYSVQT